MKSTKPVFVVGSGRCGTYSLYKAMGCLPGVEARHEPWCAQVQGLGCLRHAGQISTTPLKMVLSEMYVPAVHYSGAGLWVCVGNKESWLLGPLRELFPRAKFAWLARDGRKVCLSYYHKLAAEHYDKEAVEALTAYLDSPTEFRPPPLDKRWWWPVPTSEPERSEFIRWDRWRWVCWHFAEICRELKSNMTATGMRIYHLEEMAGDLKEFLKMTKRMGLDRVDSSDLTTAWETFRKPSNVHFPVNFEITGDQEAVYREMCGEIHEWLGYGWDKPEEVQYDD